MTSAFGPRMVLQDQAEQLSNQQRLLYASNQHALLLVFQAMDTKAPARQRHA
ncbi:MAG: hypothetical protein ABI537_06465 [Casimicrobiaceae bacterium]